MGWKNLSIYLLFFVIFASILPASAAQSPIVLKNENYTIQVNPTNGAITSFFIKKMDCELIGEKRLQANFRICLPLKDYLCNYIEGTDQKPSAINSDANAITVQFSGMSSPKGKFPIDLSYTITLAGDEVRFHSKLTNNCKEQISEFWFPRLGGWTNFGSDSNAVLQIPSYTNMIKHSLFYGFPLADWTLGSGAAESYMSYPGKYLSMPWEEIHGAGNTGLYMGYHDDIFRYSTWHYYLYPHISGTEKAWLTPAEAGGEPLGLVFSHVRYPFIANGETLDSGDFIFRVHDGDWHQGSKLYRKWFTDRWPVDKSDRWLRKQSSWFTTIAYQPEDKIVADYNLFNQWCKEAQDLSGINCYEMCGWHKGGIERDYPDYVPEEKLGGKEGFKKLMRSINSRGGKFLAFVNYNVLDENTDWYKQELYKYTHQDQFGKTPNAMCWGESTLLARTGASVRRHLLGSIVPPLEKILEDRYCDIARNGANGIQIDKLINSRAPWLDFNPMNKYKPDVALCQGLVEAIERVWKKCRQIDPNFSFAGEACQDRLIPYIDVYYRNAEKFEISPFRYVFPEWTSCAHVSYSQNFDAVNGAVMTGAVICYEPDWYQSSAANPRYKELSKYIKEVGRIRDELADIIFLGNYYDNQDAQIKTTSQDVLFKVHGDKSNRRAIVVINNSKEECSYNWKFLHRNVKQVKLYSPFESPRFVNIDEKLKIKPAALQILVEQ